MTVKSNINNLLIYQYHKYLSIPVRIPLICHWLRFLCVMSHRYVRWLSPGPRGKQGSAAVVPAAPALLLVSSPSVHTASQPLHPPSDRPQGLVTMVMAPQMSKLYRVICVNLLPQPLHTLYPVYEGTPKCLHIWWRKSPNIKKKTQLLLHHY